MWNCKNWYSSGTGPPVMSLNGRRRSEREREGRSRETRTAVTFARDLKGVAGILECLAAVIVGFEHERMPGEVRLILGLIRVDANGRLELLALNFRKDSTPHVRAYSFNARLSTSLLHLEARVTIRQRRGQSTVVSLALICREASDAESSS